MKIIIAGVNMISKNRGVQALGYGAESFIQNIFPSSEIEFISLTYDKENFPRQTNIGKKQILRFILYLLLPFLSKRDPLIKKIKNSDYIFDLTEGDSFSDIYGFERFILNIIIKITLRKFGVKYILLQQTIGPFQSNWAKWISKIIINNTNYTFVRDYDSKNLVESLGFKTKLLPDVALFLKSIKPSNFDIPFSNFVAINVNGLLFYNSYKKNLIEKNSYHDFIKEIITFLLNKKINILLVPHTYSTNNDLNEDDLAASKVIISELGRKYEKQLKVVDKDLNACELKYIISKAEFTIGSRMHACIGSLTSGKLAIALAYSYKFRGNFKNFGLEEWVINLYEKNVSLDNIIQKIKIALENNIVISKDILSKLNKMQEDCLKDFKKEFINE